MRSNNCPTALWLTLDRTAKTPLIRQLYLELRQRILQGKLAAGEKLPATRTLAAQLHISRNVVLEAYEQLIAEGYLEGRPGAGTYVATGAAWSVVAQPEPPQPPSLAPAADPGIDFRSGIPALDQFPRKQWGQMARQVCLEADPACLGYGSPAGQLELRSGLASYLQRTRGVVCQPDQIVITAGAAQAFGLVVKLLAQPGDWVALEDPGPLEVRQIFRAVGVELQPVPVDQRGLQIDHLRSSPPPRFVLVTPSHQFPLGSLLTIQRRIELLAFARTTDCLIVEDDYDSEFRFEGTPVGAMQGLDPERVIYIGTFSKILSPALRLGYLVLPPAHVAACLRLKWLSDLHNPILDQLTLARFIQSGQFERHVEQMRQLYRQRRNALRQVLQAQFGEKVSISGDSTGLHLIASFTGIDFTASRLQQLRGVKIYPVSAYAAEPDRFQHQIILGYGHLSIPEIQTGIAALAQFLGTRRS
jgi:GntR family transcriptional regulator / MocR family aminotransferase